MMATECQRRARWLRYRFDSFRQESFRDALTALSARQGYSRISDKQELWLTERVATGRPVDIEGAYLLEWPEGGPL